MAKRRANGEGSIYQRKDGTWTAQFTDCNGKKRYLYGKTQRIVKDKLKEAIRQSDTGLALEPKRTTLAEWTIEWMEVYQKPVLRGSTYSNTLLRIKRHIEPYFNRVQLKDVRQEQLQRFFNEKAIKRLDGKPGGYSPSMCMLLFNIINGGLKKAMELGYIPRNPAAKIHLRPRERGDKRIFTVDEQNRFEERVRADMKHYQNSSVYLLMLHTGLRVGEAIGLQKGDIDFKNKEFHVKRTVGIITKEGGSGVEFYTADPKTNLGKRTVPMSEMICRLLAEQIEHRDKLVEAMREKWIADGRDAEIIDAGYLYLSDRGNVIFKANLDHRMDRLLREADIPTPRVTLHGLRHTFATRWLEAGQDVRSLAEILGHSDVKMTLNVYTHSLPEQRRKGMDAMAAWLAGDTENSE